jgi:hypothetical protein
MLIDRSKVFGKTVIDRFDRCRPSCAVSSTVLLLLYLPKVFILKVFSFVKKLAFIFSNYRAIIRFFITLSIILYYIILYLFILWINIQMVRYWETFVVCCLPLCITCILHVYRDAKNASKVNSYLTTIIANRLYSTVSLLVLDLSVFPMRCRLVHWKVGLNKKNLN